MLLLLLSLLRLVLRLLLLLCMLLLLPSCRRCCSSLGFGCTCMSSPAAATRCLLLEKLDFPLYLFDAPLVLTDGAHDMVAVANVQALDQGGQRRDVDFVGPDLLEEECPQSVCSQSVGIVAVVAADKRVGLEDGRDAGKRLGLDAVLEDRLEE